MFNGNSNMILGSEHAMVPPSPGVPVPGFETPMMSTVPGSELPVRMSKRKHVRTGAGIKKSQPKKKAAGSVAKLMNAALTVNAGASEKALEKPFRFTDLPGGT
jgi:hypothetical protein